MHLVHVHLQITMDAAIVHDEAILFHLHKQVCVDVPRKKSPSLGTLNAIVLARYLFDPFLQAEKDRMTRKLFCMRRACHCRRHGHA